MKIKALVAALALPVIIVGCGGETVGSNRVLGTPVSENSDVSFATINKTTKLCTLQGTVDRNYTLDPSCTWLLKGVVFVGDVNSVTPNGDGKITGSTDPQATINAIRANGVTLTIPAGTRVTGANQEATLVVTRGSKLNANGTKEAPVIFDALEVDPDLVVSEDDLPEAAYDRQGAWGGIIINGFAPIYGGQNSGSECLNNGFCDFLFEDIPGYSFHGGNETADNSGVLNYVVIAEAGKAISTGKEVNGITLLGVGSGTSINYLQVHNSIDDGVEIFGGNVSMKNIVVTGADDDDFDYDQGWKGNAQYLFLKKDQARPAPVGVGNGPTAIEANTGNSDGKGRIRATEAVLANVTIVHLPSVYVSPASAQPAVLTRGEVRSVFHNMAVSAVASARSTACFQNNNSEATVVSVVNGLCDDTNTAVTSTTQNTTNFSVTNISGSGLFLAFDTVGAIINAGAQLSSASAPTAVGSGFTFDATDYIGAVDPDTSNTARDWISGWTVGGALTGLRSQTNTL